MKKTFKSESPTEQRFSTKVITDRLEFMEKQVDYVGCVAEALDRLGEARKYPEGSDKRALAEARDKLDHALAMLLLKAMGQARRRAEKTRNRSLLMLTQIYAQGHGHTALRLMLRCEELFAEAGDESGSGDAGSMIADFVRDTCRRVTALARLVEEFPGWFRQVAGEMNEWPMMVSDRCDPRLEFKRVAELLGIGGDRQGVGAPPPQVDPRGEDAPAPCFSPRNRR